MMKASNKVLFGGLTLMFFAGVVLAGIARSNTKVWTKEACEKLAQGSRSLQLEFDKIEISENIQVTLVQGDFSVYLEGTEEILSSMRQDVEGGVLRLNLKNEKHMPCPVVAKISCPDLKGIKAMNGSNLVSDGSFKASNIEINAMNGSQLDLNLECSQVKATAQNSADIRIHGEIDKLVVTGRNSSRIQAPYAKVNNSTVNLMNSSSAMLFSDTLSQVNVANSSSLKYIGDAHLGSVHNNNSSSVQEISQDEAHIIQDKWR